MRLALLIFVVSACMAIAAGPQPDRGPAQPTSAEVLWAAPTNGWPEKLWVYKVIPQVFSSSVLSNLLEIAAFTEKDRANPPAYIREVEPKPIYFSTSDETRHLAICPSLGWMALINEKAASPSHLQPVRGVPNQEETTRLGLRYLRLLGIDRSQLATKPGTNELELHWECGRIAYTDQETKKEITLTNNFGIYFRRRIDGIGFSGIGLRGGVYIRFGNDAKVAELQVVWRNLQPHQLLDCALPEEIVTQFKNGQIALPANTGPPAEMIKFTITYAMPYYDSTFEEEPEAYIAPRLDLIGTVERPSGPINIQLRVPIFRVTAKSTGQKD
jgi:hypothetical protein